MAEVGITGFDAEKARKGIETRILIAGLIMVVLQLLWFFYTQELASVRQQWQAKVIEELTAGKGYAMVMNQPLSIRDYFSLYGFLTLVPHDLILAMYAAAVIISVACIIVLGEALLAADGKDQKKASQLTDRGMKYFGWILTLLIFFITVHWMEESLFPFGALFQENMWIILGIAIVVTAIVRVLLSKTIKEVSVFPTAGIGLMQHKTPRAMAEQPVLKEKGVRACKFCGKSVDASDAYCPSCGRPQK